MGLIGLNINVLSPAEFEAEQIAYDYWESGLSPSNCRAIYNSILPGIKMRHVREYCQLMAIDETLVFGSEFGSEFGQTINKPVYDAIMSDKLKLMP